MLFFFWILFTHKKVQTKEFKQIAEENMFQEFQDLKQEVENVKKKTDNLTTIGEKNKQLLSNI